MLWIVPLLAGLGCAAALRTATRLRDFHAEAAAIGLTIVWALANLAWQLDALWALALIDWLYGVMALLLWVDGGDRKALIMAELVLVRLALHAGNETTGQVYLVPYIHGLNALFAAQIALAATWGSKGGNLRRRLHRFRDALRSRAPIRRAQGAPR